jgi:hypothetical protein
VGALDEAHFRQEPAYAAALIGRLVGVVYEDDDALVSFSATSITSIGPTSAERWAGADFAITATVRQGTGAIRKAILTQVKLGGLDELPRAEAERMIAQVWDMRRLTRSPKVMVVPTVNGAREPRMLSGVRLSEGHSSPGQSLPQYFVARVLTTLDGDTRPYFVDAVQDGSLADLRVYAELKRRRVSVPVPARVKVLA